MLRFSQTVRSPSLVMAWGITPMERRAVLGFLRTSAPSMMAVPEVMSSKVVIIRIRVDLPAPLGLSRPKISPSSTAKETPSTAVKFPKRFTMSMTWIAWFGISGLLLWLWEQGLQPSFREQDSSYYYPLAT